MDKVIALYSVNDFKKFNNIVQFINVYKWKDYQLEEQMLEIKHKSDIRLRNYIYEVGEQLNCNSLRYPKFASDSEAIYKLSKEDCSIIRFGDGEFEIINGRNRAPFQTYNSKLAFELKKILQSNDNKLLIAIAKNYGDLSMYPDDVADGIRDYMTVDVRKEHYDLLDFSRVYYDAYLFKCFYPHKDRCNTLDRINEVKKVWQNRKIVLIEGDKTRTGYGNDLFDNALSIERILCPTKNAYDFMDEISDCSERIEKEKLIVIVLGPAGKVLAYKLFKLGYQVIDIGQIDMDYDWYLSGSGIKIGNKYKYVSQVSQNQIYDLKDKSYLNQVVARIGV